MVICTQTIDDLKQRIASNNKRRITYGLPSRRGNMNADRVAKRRKEKLYRKRHIKPVYYVDEGNFLFNMLRTARRYQPPAEVFKYPPRTSHAAPDFSPVPYDFDAEKNALTVQLQHSPSHNGYYNFRTKRELMGILLSGQKPVILDTEREYANLTKELIYETKNE